MRKTTDIPREERAVYKKGTRSAPIAERCSRLCESILHLSRQQTSIFCDDIRQEWRSIAAHQQSRFV